MHALHIIIDGHRSFRSFDAYACGKLFASVCGGTLRARLQGLNDSFYPPPFSIRFRWTRMALFVKPIVSAATWTNVHPRLVNDLSRVSLDSVSLSLLSLLWLPCLPIHVMGRF